MRVSRHHSAVAPAAKPALYLFVLLLVQIALGAASYLTKFGVWIVPYDVVVLLTTMHLAVGALMLAVSVGLTLQAHRISGHPAVGHRSKEMLAEQFS